ncbi:MAG TPA: hypothetical protein VKA84_01025 [Gemmatimonadaceae bacterium]|nr:hypothetical protein [Gemmatimonadaceae bacterium]
MFPQRLVPQRLTLANGKAVTLDVAEGYEVTVAARGLRRPRWMAAVPDDSGRVVLSDLYSRADNRRGAVYVLERFDGGRGRFAAARRYVAGQRNPQGLAFAPRAGGGQWLYVALTDSLVRYAWAAGDTAPRAAPELVATFPGYGRPAEEGGWHLTRTVVVGPNGRLYVSVGSSCNVCVEREPERAAVLEVDPATKRRRVYARGLRNAVGLVWAGGRLYATNMGVDHLGSDQPAEPLYEVRDGAHYGWPLCYEPGGGAAARRDTLMEPLLSPRPSVDCARVPRPLAAFPAHSAPLGVESDGDHFLVALHGSAYRRLGRGYAVVRVARDGSWEPLVAGFLRSGRVQGRPADVMRFRGGFLVTDDVAGVVYYVRKKVK